MGDAFPRLGQSWKAASTVYEHLFFIGFTEIEL
jgi:hypothetical protein